MSTLVAETPLVPIHLQVGGRLRSVALKLEGESAGGSLKDRTAASLIADLERRGLLTAGATVIESTSGNLGVSLARLARERGYRFLAVVDPKLTPELLERLLALDARVETVAEPDANGGYLLSRLARVQTLLTTWPELVWPNQYASPANPLAHERSTAPELYRQLGGGVDAVVAAVSTGGTLCGLARFFRRMSPKTRIVAVDALGSVALGGPAGPRLLTGVGSSQRSLFATRDLYDERLLISDAEAFACCHTLLDRAEISVGGSSGAVLAAAVRYLAANPQAERVACLCPDRGDAYASTVFDAGWLALHGLSAEDPGLIEGLWRADFST